MNDFSKCPPVVGYQDDDGHLVILSGFDCAEAAAASGLDGYPAYVIKEPTEDQQTRILDYPRSPHPHSDDVMYGEGHRRFAAFLWQIGVEAG